MTSTKHKKIKNSGSFRTASMAAVMSVLLVITMFAAGCEKPAEDSSGEYATASDLPASPAVSASAAASASAPQPRDEFAAIPVHVEGEVEYRQAKLHYSDDMSYSLYVLDYFTYSAEEPGKDIVMSNYDGEYFVRIERLAPDINIDEFKNGLKKAYGEMGNVIERNPAELYFEEFRDAKFWLHVDVLNENGSVKTSLQYLMKEIGGNRYGFFFHMPAKEASEGLTPSMWAIVLTMK